MTAERKLLALCAYLLLLESCPLYVWGKVGSESCSGRCGQQWSLPCSCHATCAVYNNCCEDINLLCPEILKESQAQFDKHVRNHVGCTDNGFFTIAGCMRPSDKGQNYTTPRSGERQNAPLTSDETSVLSKISKFVGKSKSFRSLFTMLSSTHEPMKSLGQTFMRAPITDTSTGLVYKNFTIFSCDATNLSVPHVWDATALSLSLSELDNTQGLSKVFDTAEVVYTPPHHMSSLSRCRPDCLDYCEKEMDDESKDLRDKCEQEGFMYVKFSTNTEATCYKNIYCGQCNMNTSVIPSFVEYPYPVRANRKLSISMYLSGANLKVSPGNSESRYNVPWEELTCPIETLSAKLVDDDMKCHVKSCGAGYVKRPDGVCRFPVYDKFAVADDDVPLTADDIRILPKFVQCLIKEAIQDEIVTVRPDVSTVHDTRLNKTVHVTYIESFATHRGALLATQQNSREALVKLSAITKSFQRYRQNKRMSLASKGSRDSLSLEDARDDSHTSNTANLSLPSLTTFELSLSQATLSAQNWNRGAVVDNATKTTTCVCRGSRTEECALLCLQDLWYVKESTIISEFLDLPCLANKGTRSSQKSNQADSGQKLKVLALVFMICMYVIIW